MVPSPAKKSAARPAAGPSGAGGGDGITVRPMSKAFEPYAKQAEKILKDRAKTEDLVRKARQKVADNEKEKGPLRPVWNKLLTMIDVVESHAAGRTTNVSWNTVVLCAGALVYLVSPGDFVPDWIPEVGLSDDAAVVGMVLVTVQDDLDRFQRPARRPA